MTSRGRIAVGAVVLALVVGGTGAVVGLLVGSDSGGSGVPATAGTPCDVTEVAAQVFPSLVTITVQGAGGSGTGSGSVLDTQGNILTNDHVIETADAGGITVDFARGHARVPARIVGRDPATDLAVIGVAPDAVTLTPIAVGESAALVVGQPVVAAGSPLGLTGTITSGTVSALNRYIDVGQGQAPATLINAIQTDAAINPGNSGGPLTDCAGRQVGVNSAGAQAPGTGGGGSIGLNFAIPMDFARSVADQLVRTGRAGHPTIGVLAVTVTAEMATATGLPRGALVEQVVTGLGAGRAGIGPGDVITRIGTATVTSVDQMLVAVRGYDPGDSAQVGYVRNGSQSTTTIVVGGQ
ncbi:PDZ domain-containing protein [Amycolatopsis balhimycina DSM 5908]|uniref:PDZ domain-containing protein n=1 Tax=Amycolatopsis balhimycina DSM 5908 TaxID=1081091 RepID=A0A428X6G1_AMYBA|nr:trypsin-like peptidase domain-containing protein [Amycolatopsis balhimycina]RSM50896.1 PDZ domain-containing protein [Amycolatopsis balhimycina DSM 5908]